MKILAACHAGICRSAAMSRELKRHGHDVLVVGLEGNSPETVKMLGDWAQKIVVMQKELLPMVPSEFSDKIVLADVGPDVWGDPSSEDLRNRVKVMVEAWKEKDWDMSHLSLRPA
jgi:hypothetical protein